MQKFRMIRAETAVEEMGKIVEQQREVLLTARGRYESAETQTDGLAAAYAILITAIDNQAAANPNNVALQVLKGRKDQFLLEATRVAAHAGALKTAVTGVNEQ